MNKRYKYVADKDRDGNLIVALENGSVDVHKMEVGSDGNIKTKGDHHYAALTVVVQTDDDDDTPKAMRDHLDLVIRKLNY